MVRAVFTTHGPLTGTEDLALVGINDLLITQGATGATLFAATRGDGWLTAFNLGDDAGATQLEQHWQIDAAYLQLETTDLVLRDLPGADQLYLAGLRSTELVGVSIGPSGSPTPIGSTLSAPTSNLDAGRITEMDLFTGTDTGLAALRGGGLIGTSFAADGSLITRDLADAGPLANARATDIATTTFNGDNLAFVTYQSQDAVALFRQASDGTLNHLDTADATDGLITDRPGDLAITSASDGGLYVVVAGFGTDSLSVLTVADDTLVPVDHILDTTTTRFANASHVTAVEVADHNFILAAGSDNGISVFSVLPGGRLQHVQDMAGTAEVPLKGITALDAIAVPTGIRIWASTEAAPFLAEFSLTFPDLGLNQVAGDGSLTGTAADDVLTGSAGDNLISGGAGRDILVDGAGSDTLSGGGGSDTFVLLKDAQRDVIQDFQIGSDRIDLTDFGVADGVGSMTINSRSWGAEIRLGDDILEVRSADGQRLSTNDFDAANLLTGNRIAPDPPDTTDAPNQPPPVPGDNADPVEQGDPQPVLPSQMTGTSGNDMLRSFAQNDQLSGAAGDDTLFADAGRDQLNGGGGNDLLFGGANADEFVFENNHGNDTIADFDATDPDEVIDLTLHDTFQDYRDVQQAAEQSGRDVLINSGDNSSIRLRDVDLNDLDESDFAF